MKYLHLDSSFKPYGPSISFEAFTFNGGEPHIRILEKDLGEAITITHRINSFNDLGLLLIATDALRRIKVKRINAFIPYFPGARQDRIMTPGEALSVKVYADVINAQNYDQVTIFDAHSEVTIALLDNVNVIDNHEFVKQCIGHIKDDIVLVSPDGGALKKVYKLSAFLYGIEVIECSKQRDVNNGKLSGFKVYAEDLQSKHVIIVDDICDGGGTFLGLAEALNEKKAGKLSLIISHGIFSKGFEELTKVFDTIFTSNSVQDIQEDGIIQLTI